MSTSAPSLEPRVRHDVRNIAIIAHVDHGKTTLVDAMLRQSGVFRDNQVVAERVMDSNDLEREKGITILSKVTSVNWNDVRINIVDTPGHSDFGGEVERILRSVDGVLLLVDACEGPMPQTRFVLRKALQQNLKPLVVINKIDRPGARPYDVVDEVLDLFIELGCPEHMLDFPYLFASAAQGYAVLRPEDPPSGIAPLFDMVLREVPPPAADCDGPFQLQITNLDYDDYVGRLFGGKILRGRVRKGDTLSLIKRDGTVQTFTVSKLYAWQGLNQIEPESASAGDIILMAGCEELQIGETICAPDALDPLPLIDIDEPTVSMDFIVNNGPWAGRSGKWLMMRNLKARLERETRVNISLRVEPGDQHDTLKVSGRGELQLAILIETMRRELYEVMVSRPQAITKEIDGVLCEPAEELTIDVHDDALGAVIDEVSRRRGELLFMEKDPSGLNRLVFEAPTRGLMGFRSVFLTLTRGLGLMSHVFKRYAPWRGDIPVRSTGSLIAKETGIATAYAIESIQERATLFVSPGEEVYEGQIVGENSRAEDMVVNICRAKQKTNVRSSTKEATVGITPPKRFLLEQALGFLADDELLECTPDALRFRKRILNTVERGVAARRGD